MAIWDVILRFVEQDKKKKKITNYMDYIAGRLGLACLTPKLEVCSSNSCILPLLKHACRRRQLAAMLALYTGIGVTPDLNLSECISHMPPPMYE